MKQWLIVSVLCVVIGLGNIGCATLVTGGKPDQKVRFSSEPEGASVNVDGKAVGKTPITVPLARDIDHKITMSLAGYPKFEKDIKSGFNGWVLGNLIIGGLFGICVDAISGATDGLDPSSVSVNFLELREKQAADRKAGLTAK